MLAKFENGWYLEVVINEKENEYKFATYENNRDWFADDYTEYRSIDMYYPMNEIDYILEFCKPPFLEGKYKILEEKTMEEYLDKYEYNFDLDSEEELIQKAFHNNQLFVCLADKDYTMLVLANYETEAEDYAYDWYCETCFEPGHWSAWKATEDDLGDFYDKFLIANDGE